MIETVVRFGVVVALLTVGCGDGQPTFDCGQTRCDPTGGAGGDGGTAGAGGVGGMAGVGGVGGSGGVSGQCLVQEDCPERRVVCIPEYRGLPLLDEGFPIVPEGEVGVCKHTSTFDSTLFLPEVTLFDEMGQVVAGNFDVLVWWGSSRNDVIPEDWVGHKPSVPFPNNLESTVSLYGGYPIFFGIRRYFEIRESYDDETALGVCDISVDPFNGMVSGGTIIEGNSMRGTLRCTDERVTVRFEVCPVHDEDNCETINELRALYPGGYL